MFVWLLATFVVATAVTLDDIESGFDDQTLANVRVNLLEIATERYVLLVFSLSSPNIYCISWELGTAAEALTEFSWPALSVFNISAFPPPIHLNDSYNASDVLSIAEQYVSNLSLIHHLIDCDIAES